MLHDITASFALPRPLRAKFPHAAKFENLSHFIVRAAAIEFAVVTGKFHLDRTAHGDAAKDDGIFSLVWRKGPKGWKIVLDHTS